MKAFFLTTVIVAGLIFIVYLLDPLLFVKAWNQYKAPIGSEKFCQRYAVVDCPTTCTARPNSLIDDKDLGCHEIKLYNKTN